LNKEIRLEMILIWIFHFQLLVIESINVDESEIGLNVNTFQNETNNDFFCSGLRLRKIV
jgi:hypothetical protein